MKNTLKYLICIALLTSSFSKAQSNDKNLGCECLSFEEVYFKKNNVDPQEFMTYILLFDIYFTYKPTKYIKDYFKYPYLAIGGNGKPYNNSIDKNDSNISSIPEDVFIANSNNIFGDFSVKFLSNFQQPILESLFNKMKIDKIHKKHTIFLQTYWRYKNCVPFEIEKQLHNYKY